MIKDDVIKRIVAAHGGSVRQLGKNTYNVSIPGTKDWELVNADGSEWDKATLCKLICPVVTCCIAVRDEEGLEKAIEVAKQRWKK